MKIVTSTTGILLEIELTPGQDGEVYLSQSDHLVPALLITELSTPCMFVYKFSLCIGGESSCRLIIFRENKKYTWHLYRTVELLQSYGEC